jgi:hypothetical protein
MLKLQVDASLQLTYSMTCAARLLQNRQPRLIRDGPLADASLTQASNKAIVAR